MSRVPMGAQMASRAAHRAGLGYAARYGAEFPNQGVGAEMIADQWNLAATQLDELSLASHEPAAAATDSGAFEAEIAPCPTAGGVVSVDEGIRRGGTLEKLGVPAAGLPPRAAR